MYSRDTICFFPSREVGVNAVAMFGEVGDDGGEPAEMSFGLYMLKEWEATYTRKTRLAFDAPVFDHKAVIRAGVPVGLADGSCDSMILHSSD